MVVDYRHIKILTVLNGVSGNGLGKGTAGAAGACGATLPTLYKGHDGENVNTRALGYHFPVGANFLRGANFPVGANFDF